jgi:hypothetical protein
VPPAAERGARRLIASAFAGPDNAEVEEDMAARTGIARVASLVAAVGLGTGCAYNNYVEYGAGWVDYSGSRIEYLEATPAPGTVVAQGSSVEFKVRVRYTLQRSREGRLVVWFTDRHDAPLPVDAIAIPISQSVSTIDTVTREILVPPTSRDLVLHVGVVAGAETTPSGDVQLTYLVRQTR